MAQATGETVLSRYISLGILLFALWFLLSGHTEPLMLGFGVVSVIFSIYIAHRFELLDKDSHPIHLSGKLFVFWFKLGYKIIVANIDVALTILGIRKPSPQLVKIPNHKGGDLAKVIYANAITLTPGSASVHLENGDLLVHTLNKEGAQELFTGEMAGLIPSEDNLDKEQP